MKILSVFAFALILTSGFCQDPDPTTAETTTVQSTTDTPTTETTKIDTTTVLSTTAVDTTTVPSTTTTKTDTTTTATSTTKTDATTVLTTSSTPVPITTSTASSTTVKTTPTTVITSSVGPITTPQPPTPDLGEWNVTDGNITCIRADLKIRFKIPVADNFVYLTLSPNATVDSGSSCNATNGTQVLVLRDSLSTFSMTFDKDGNTKTYVKEISLSYNLPPNIAGNVASETPQFSVQSGSSYLCNTGTVDLQNVTMEIVHIQLQSFGTETNLAFGATEECEADNKVNDMVPIIVGCALLALVVVVLIAYFVGRRRSRQKGYQSV